MKCILHIGTEKTGTTTIQEWLYDNRSRLSAQGVGLTVSAGRPFSRKLVAFFQQRSDNYFKIHGLDDEARRAAFFDGFADAFRAEVATLARTHHTVIITSEHFHSRYRSVEEVQALRDFLAPLFTEMRVLCYFREQSRMRTSLYSTVLKVETEKTLAEFHSDIGEDSHLYNYEGLFGMWEAAFGFDNVEAAIFERDRLFDGDIRKDFIRRAFADIDLERLSYRVDGSNESLSAPQAFFARLINQAVPRFGLMGLNHLNLEMKKRVLPEKALKGRALRDPLQAEIYRRFDASNRRFFARYFGVDDNLFPPPASAAEADAAPFDSIEHATEAAEAAFRAALETPGLIALSRAEVDTLRDVAIRLEQAGQISRQEAVTILAIAQRARPAGRFIKNKLKDWTRALTS